MGFFDAVTNSFNDAVDAAGEAIHEVTTDPAGAPGKAGTAITNAATDVFQSEKGERKRAKGTGENEDPPPVKDPKIGNPGKPEPKPGSYHGTAPAPANGSAPGGSPASTGWGKDDAYAFLDDPNINLDDKLFLLLAQMTHDSEKKLLDVMDKMRDANKAKEAKDAYDKDGAAAFPSIDLNSVLDQIKDAVKNGDLNKLSDIGSDLGKKFEAPVVGVIVGIALSTVMGPEGMQIGKMAGELTKRGFELGDAIRHSEAASAQQKQAEAKNGGKATDAEGLSHTGDAVYDKAMNSDDPEVVKAALQNMVEKQQQMVALFSNIMKIRHDSAMQVIGNIR
jgi:hypothetical protein